MQATKEVRDLQAGDKTPWYSVVSGAEPAVKPGTYRVLVRHNDNGVVDYVHGDAAERVPITNAR